MRRKPLFISVPLLAAALFVTSASLPVGVALAQNGTYNAATIQDSTDLLAGPSNTFYVVGQVPKGSTVVVHELLAGWYKITPPQGALSVVAKSAVKPSDDKKTGEVLTDKTEVFALNPKAIGESNRKQGTLAKGAKVQIQGEDGAFYKITPPAEAYVFLKPGSVRRLDLIDSKQAATTPPAIPAPAVAPAPVPQPKSAGPATTQPLPPEAQPLAPKPPAPPANKAQADISAAKGDPTGTPYVAPAPKSAEPAKKAEKPAPAPKKAAEPAPAAASAPAPAPAAPAAAAAQTNPDSPALNTLELKLEEIQQLPLEQQPLADLLKQYEKMSEDTSLSRRDGLIIKARLTQLPKSMDIAKTLKDISKVEIPAAENKGTPGVTVTTKETTQTTESKELINKDPVKYDAVGTLLASAVYDGTDAPRLYRLTDTANSRTIVYVQPSDNFEPRQVLGQVVGIVGQTTYNPGLGLRIIAVDRIDIMQSVPAGGAK